MPALYRQHGAESYHGAVMLTFGRFLLQAVLGHISQDEAAEVSRMWIEEGVLPAHEAERRAKEVLFLFREQGSGHLAGVCTVYPQLLGQTGRNYWHFRMFMRRSFRGVSGLPRFVLMASYRYLQEMPPSGPSHPGGMVIVAENPAFRRHRFRDHFAKEKPPWTFYGTDKNGFDIFYCDFANRTDQVP